MKIDLSNEQGALVPLYFFRKPLGWPEENEKLKMKEERLWQK